MVWAIADRLAQPHGGWAPLRPPAMLRALFPRPDILSQPATDPALWIEASG